MPAASRGITFMAVSAVAFSVMAALVKLAAPIVPNQELVALRSLASIVPIVVLMRWRGVPVRFNRPGWLFLRGLFGYVAISCWFLSLDHLSLPDSVMIQYTSPVFVALMAPLFLREPSRRRDRWALAVALCGVALVVRPGFGLTAAGALIGLAGAPRRRDGRRLGGGAGPDDPPPRPAARGRGSRASDRRLRRSSAGGRASPSPYPSRRTRGGRSACCPCKTDRLS